jgi:DNA repair protein RadC
VLKWVVPRRREKSPYQLPFEFGRQSVEDTTVYRALLHSLAAESQESRFVRVVRDEIVVRSPADAAMHLLKEVFVPFERLDQEELWVLLLSTRNRITHEVMLYRGTVDTVLVRPAEVFKEAVRVNAAAVLLAHNHPSGESSPSPQDVQLTELVSQAGELLGIHLVDHIVVGYQTWTSLRERGLGFSKQQ